MLTDEKFWIGVLIGVVAYYLLAGPVMKKARGG